MLWLKQSTAVTFQLGPFVDVGDGVTPETGLATNMDNATTGIRVSKNGVASIDRNSATAPAHDDDGYYRVELSTTDTNALGTLHVQYEELGVTLPMWKDFMVVTANIWDTFFSTDQLDVNVTNMAADTITAAVMAVGAIASDAFVAGAIDNAAMSIDGSELSAIPWNAAWDAEVESEVNDALDTVISELSVAAPAATPTIRTAIMLLYMALRNKTVVQTSGVDALEIYNDAGTKIAAKALTDDGSDYTEAEMA